MIALATKRQGGSKYTKHTKESEIRRPVVDPRCSRVCGLKAKNRVEPVHQICHPGNIRRVFGLSSHMEFEFLPIAVPDK